MTNSRIALCLAASLTFCLPGLSARAGIDAPGTFVFDFISEPDFVFQSWTDVPEEGVRIEADAFFSSDASTFGEDGVFIWIGFEFLDASAPRAGVLLLDLDLTQAPLDGNSPMPHSAIRAEYIEKWGEEVFFAGDVAFGDIWLVDIFFHESDDGALEGDLALVMSDPSQTFGGSRALIKGRFITNPSPTKLREIMGISDHETDTVVYVDTSCSGDLYLADNSGEGCDCGGEDPDSGGCEGDTTSDSSGCEGDSGGGDCSGGGGCEGDAGGCSGGSGGSCSGGGGGSCSGGGSPTCATSGRALRRSNPIRNVMRFFPEMCVFAFIFLMKKKYRKK
jgi:hypothetical protein